MGFSIKSKLFEYVEEIQSAQYVEKQYKASVPLQMVVSSRLQSMISIMMCQII